MKKTAVLLVSCLALAAGCGDDEGEDGGGGGGGSDEPTRLVVSAAASMTEALEACAPEFGEAENADVKLSFAGSDELAAQIRQGAKVDAYAAANTRLPDELYQDDLLSKPVEFATNEFAPAQEKAILDNVRSNEPDVKGIVGKLTQGAADAGFVYITDVQATNGELKAIKLPANLEPDVTYGAGVVTEAQQPELAQQFVDGLSDGACATALQEAGFGKP